MRKSNVLISGLVLTAALAYWHPWSSNSDDKTDKDRQETAELPKKPRKQRPTLQLEAPPAAAPAANDNEDALYAAVSSLPPDVDPQLLKEGLMSIAQKTKNVDRGLAFFEKYGWQALPASSTLVNRFAADNPGIPERYIEKTLKDFHNASDLPPAANGAYCNAIAKIRGYDVNEAVFKQIQSEDDADKRKGLYYVYTMNRALPVEFSQRLIAQALSDDDPGIHALGEVWQENGRVLKSSELAPYQQRLVVGRSE